METHQESTTLDRNVRFHVYDFCINEGRPPTLTETAAALSLTTDDIRSSFERLADGHILVLQKGNGEILMANPFSAVPTPFVVHTAERSYFSNCIWDALGISAMLRTDATIHASCGCCNTAMNLSIHQGSLENSEGLAHFAIPAAHWWDDIVFN